MPPKRFEGKFGIPSSYEPESLLTSALYRLPESGDGVRWVKEFSSAIASMVNVRNILEQRNELTEAEVHILTLKLARHYEDNGESAPIDIATCVDALIESPNFLRNDRGSITKLFELHEMKTLQKIAELRRKRAEITTGDASELNPYENLFETTSGDYYLARLLNMPHLEEESTYMHHCVGTSDSYVNKMKRGEVEIFSFRSTKTHNPIVTIEYDTKSQRLLQVKGVGDEIPNFNDNVALDLLEALSQLPETINDNGEHRLVKSNEVAHLTRLLELEEKVHADEELTRDELFFLYEVNEPIQGFDVSGREPLIDHLLYMRDRKEDIITMTDCAPEHLTTDFTELSTETEVYCEDTGSKITLVDFREAKNKAKLPQLIELAQKLKETGSPARPDLSFEGGSISLEITPTVQEQLKDWNTARKAYEDADSTPTWIYDELKNIPWAPPANTSLDVLVLSQGETTPQQRDTLVAHMDAAGYRPLTFSELVALGISRPDLNKRNEILNTYEKHTLGGVSLAPFLYWRGVGRRLDAGWVDVEWDELGRFLFVRKS